MSNQMVEVGQLFGFYLIVISDTTEDLFDQLQEPGSGSSGSGGSVGGVSFVLTKKLQDLANAEVGALNALELPKSISFLFWLSLSPSSIRTRCGLQEPKLNQKRRRATSSTICTLK